MCCVICVIVIIITAAGVHLPYRVFIWAVKFSEQTVVLFKFQSAQIGISIWQIVLWTVVSYLEQNVCKLTQVNRTESWLKEN